jgi:hypothetical protein
MFGMASVRGAAVAFVALTLGAFAASSAFALAASEELMELYTKARASRIRESLLPTDPFDCDDLGIVGVLVGVGLTLLVFPEEWRFFSVV